MALSCAMLAGPLMAVAIAVSSAMGGLAALLAPPQQRGSGLHARQEFLEPEQCFSICNPTLTAVNVSLSTLYHKHGSRRYHTLTYQLIELPRRTVPVHDSELGCGLQVYAVCRYMGAVGYERSRRPNSANQLSLFFSRDISPDAYTLVCHRI